MKKTGCKMRILLLMDIMENYTDDNHPLSANDIVCMLKEMGIQSERKSIYDDIQTLIQFGMDINKATFPKRGYFLAKRKFELPEIKFLIDCVESSFSLTKKKTKVLLDKLLSLASEYQCDEVYDKLLTTTKLKSNNEEIYYNLYIINKAIETGEKINFYYTKYNFQNFEIKSNKTFVRSLEPYRLVINMGRYYLIGKVSEENRFVRYKVDKIKSINIMCNNYSEIINDFDRHTRQTEFIHKNEMNLCLIFDKMFIDDFIDYFGNELKISTYKDKYLKCSFNVNFNLDIENWLLVNSDFVYVKSPDLIRNMLNNKLLNMKNFNERLNVMFN